jgi:hypothetical protein
VSQKGRSEATAVGLGCAALAYVLENEDRLNEFELFLVSETGMMPDYKTGNATWREAVTCAERVCGHLARLFVKVGVHT